MISHIDLVRQRSEYLTRRVKELLRNYQKVPPKKRMSYRFPPYVPASKDLTEKYSPSDTEIKCALREICSGPLWEEKNDMETVKKNSRLRQKN